MTGLARSPALLRETLKHLGPNAFAEFAMQDKDGRRWRQQPFHREWQALIPRQGPGRTLIVAPREHAKTTQLAARVIWELGRNPNLRVKVAAAGDTLAEQIVSEISQHIERNERVQLVFPHLKPDREAGWAKTTLYLQRSVIQKDPSVEASGLLSSGVGGRADLLIADDVMDPRIALGSPSVREHAKRIWREVWSNLVPPDGRIVMAGTVWHQDDLIAEVRRNPEWQVWRRPALHEVTGAPLWPGKWGKAQLEAKLREIGPRSFSRQFQLVPLSDDEATFPEPLLAACMARGREWAPGQVQAPSNWQRVIGVDLASSMGAKAAFTVAFVLAVEPGTERRYPLEIHRGRLKFPETVALVRDLWLRHRPAQIRVENNGYQEALLQQLRKEFPAMPVVAHTTGRNKADEKIGLPGLSATMANGGWVIPSGGEPHPADCPCAWCAWVSELRGHPVAPHSDTVMAMWLADAAVAVRQPAIRIGRA